jgi:hypothetical protein
MAATSLAQKYLRALCLSLWLSQPFWLVAGLARAQAASRCGEDAELLTPSAWCTIERSRYLLTETELITPDAWSTLLDPFADHVPESELVTPDDWRVR